MTGVPTLNYSKKKKKTICFSFFRERKRLLGKESNEKIKNIKTSTVWYSTPKFAATTREILEDLGRGLGESSWYRVQSSYSTKSGGAMTQALRFGDNSPVVNEGANF